MLLDSGLNQKLLFRIFIRLFLKLIFHIIQVLADIYEHMIRENAVILIAHFGWSFFKSKFLLHGDRIGIHQVDKRRVHISGFPNTVVEIESLGLGLVSHKYIVEGAENFTVVFDSIVDIFLLLLRHRLFRSNSFLQGLLFLCRTFIFARCGRLSNKTLVLRFLDLFRCFLNNFFIKKSFFFFSRLNLSPNFFELLFLLYLNVFAITFHFLL